MENEKFIFITKDTIIGVCSEDQLKDFSKKICEKISNAKDDVEVYLAPENELLDGIPTFEFDIYTDWEDDREKQYLGLRLAGIGGQIDYPLGIEI